MSHYSNLEIQLSAFVDLKIRIYLIEKELELLDVEIAKIKNKIMEIYTYGMV
jgi:hypothetical protein